MIAELQLAAGFGGVFVGSVSPRLIERFSTVRCHPFCLNVAVCEVVAENVRYELCRCIPS